MSEGIENRVKRAEREVHVCLNYGGVFHDGGPTTKELELAYDQGKLTDEVPQIRRFAAALNELADALEAEGQEAQEALTEREADLYYAYQLGCSFVSEADGAAVKAGFDQKFGDDTEALEQFSAGVKSEEAQRADLGMTPEQYHAHHEAKYRAFRERREAIHTASLGR